MKYSTEFCNEVELLDCFPTHSESIFKIIKIIAHKFHLSINLQYTTNRFSQYADEH